MDCHLLAYIQILFQGCLNCSPCAISGLPEPLMLLTEWSPPSQPVGPFQRPGGAHKRIVWTPLFSLILKIWADVSMYKIQCRCLSSAIVPRGGAERRSFSALYHLGLPFEVMLFKSTFCSKLGLGTAITYGDFLFSPRGPCQCSHKSAWLLRFYDCEWQLTLS